MKIIPLTQGKFIGRNKLTNGTLRIKFNERTIYLGVFAEARQAARAYNKAAKKLFGRFAHLNKL